MKNSVATPLKEKVTKNASPNIMLNGNEELIIGTKAFNLVEVTPEELAVFRKSGIQSFVLKSNGNLYWTEIPNISFLSAKILGNHMCAVPSKECNRLSPAKDEDGGCAKVRNFSRNIENYDFITDGFETFNVSPEVFHVARCLYYEKCPKIPLPPTPKINAMKASLEELYYDPGIF